MRVLEGETLSTYKMGKNKKHRLRKSKENEVGGSDSTDEGLAAPISLICPHINKSVNPAAMRKTILKTACGECVVCSKDNKATKEKETHAVEETASGGAAGIDDIENESTIWVCLQCGYQGCDRNSKDKHALKHYETPHSGCHCVTVNLTTWLCWCYTCDDFIPVETSKRIQECIEFLRKQSGLSNTTEHSSGRRVLEAINNNPQPKLETEQASVFTRPITPKTGSSIVCQKVKGLCNLGNTCFFNAVMQNLSQSHSLETLLVEKTEKGRPMRLPGHTMLDIESGGSSEEDGEEETYNKDMSSIDLVPAECGPLTQSLLGFIFEMNKGAGKGSGSSTVNPSALFGQICKKAPRFKGFQQQDSHELLRYLLDVIRTEEVKRTQTGILKHFNVNPKTVDEDTKAKVKEYGRQAKHTFIDGLFGGQLVSTVMCEECKHISQIFEPFLDLSLPVTEEKPLRPNMIVCGKKKSVEDEEGQTLKSTEGTKEKPNNKCLSKKGRKQLKKEQRRKGNVSHKSNKQEDPIFSDEVKEEDGDEGKDETTNDESRTIVDGEKEETEENHDPSDADVEDNLDMDASKLYGGASANNGITSVPIITHDLPSPCVANPNSLIALNKSNPELQNTLNNDSAQLTIHSRSDDGSIDADSSSVTLVDNDSSNLLTSTESSLTTSSMGSSHKTKSTDSSRSSTCDIKYDQDITDGNCMRKGLSESLNELHLEDSRSRLGGNGADMVEDLTKKLNYLNLDVSGSAGGMLDNTDIPYIDSVESPEISVLPHILNTPGQQDLPALDLNGISDHNSTNHQKYRSALRKEAQYKSMSTLSARYQSVGKECSILSCLHQFTSAELLTGSNKVSCERCTKIKNKKSAINKVDKKKSDSVCSNASKQYLIFQPPAVLTLHLKRFEQIGFASRKVNRHVDFPLLLDLAPYCSSLCQGIQPGQKKVLYSLYGVVEHSGRLSGGHYTAFVKVRPNMNSVVSFIHPNFTFPKEYIHRYVERSINGPKSPETDISDKAIESLIPPGKWYHISDSHVHEVTESTVTHAQAYLLFYERIF